MECHSPLFASSATLFRFAAAEAVKALDTKAAVTKTAVAANMREASVVPRFRRRGAMPAISASDPMPTIHTALTINITLKDKSLGVVLRSKAA